jgi:WD40 repeat protein
MITHIKCPNCDLDNILYSKKRNLYICEDCNYEFKLVQESSHLRIFLSYGHDQNEELVKKIKTDLEKRGHDVWFDKNEIKSGNDWRRSITEGLINSQRVLSFLSKHSTRAPGVCLDEIAIAIGVKGGNIQTILVEGEREVKMPPSISHIQWLDMQNWKEKKEEGAEIWDKWYQEKLNNIIDVIESVDNRRFAGEIESLAGYLKPISSDSRIAHLLQKGFVGREWLTNALEAWRTSDDRSSRLFWIMGNPGVGKSAFSAHLSHFGKDKIIAAHFCEYDKADHRDAKRVICSLAFQLATRLPDYRKILLTLPEINTLESKGAFELFEYLFANPLKLVIEGGRERYLVLIDALDEAKEGDRNPLVELLALNAARLPEWLGIVVTSRPENNVTDPLQGLNPNILDTDSELNKEDIRQFLLTELFDQLRERSDVENIVEIILDKSEGVFLYAEKVCRDIKDNILSLNNLEDFPKGLGGIYFQFFQRQYSDIEKYKKEIRPALRIIIAAEEPMPANLLCSLFNWQREDFNYFNRMIGSLFPLMIENGQKVLKPYHKSIIDWITNENTAGVYFIDVLEGHKILADFGWIQFQNKLEYLDFYFVKWLPRHFIKLEKWDNLVELICDLDFIQKKAAAKLIYHLIEDFNYVLQNIPDNKILLQIEHDHQTRLNKYIQDLRFYANGEIIELDIIDSIRPLTSESIKAEVEYLKSNLTRLDILNDFNCFLKQEANYFQECASEISHLVTQQAWNYANNGPVGKQAEKIAKDVFKSILIRAKYNRPDWNPFPQRILTLKGHNDWINDISITLDGRKAISGANDYTCLVWDLSTGNVIFTLENSTHRSNVTAVYITPDGQRAISGYQDGTCVFWNLITGKAIHILQGHQTKVNTVIVKGNEQQAISFDDNSFILWDLVTGEIIDNYKDKQNEIEFIKASVTPNFHWAIASIGTSCILFNLNTLEVVHQLNGHKDKVFSVSITPDGKRAISSSRDKTCILWDLMTGEIMHILKGHSDMVLAVSITPDGKMAISGSMDKTCILWNLLTGDTIKVLNGHAADIRSLSITPDGRKAISGSLDSNCILWDLETSKINQPRKSKIISALSVNSNGQIAISGNNDNTYSLWNLNTGKEKQAVNGDFKCISFMPDNLKVVYATWEGICNLLDLQTNKSIQIMEGHTRLVACLSVTPDGQMMISGSEDKTIILWNLKTGKSIRAYKASISSFRQISISPDGLFAIIPSFGFGINGILWKLKTGNIVETLKGFMIGSITSISISPDGKKAISGDMNKTCILWDLKTGEIIKKLIGHSHWVWDVCFTPDGNRVISLSEDRSCILWDINSGNYIARHFAPCQIYAAKYFPCGIILSAGSEGLIIMNVDRELLCPGIPITTIRQIWDFELKQFQQLSADCPLCGHRFAPPSSVMETIVAITKKAGLKSEQSPCLELPEEAWEDPGLLGECPNCNEKLKFNPFIAGGDEIL